MANTSTYVSTGKPNIAGGVWVGPTSATLPTDATTAMGTVDSNYVCLGYVSEDGVENANDMDVSEIKAWGGSIVYRSLNGIDDTFSFSLIESENLDVLKTVYGEDNVSTDSDTGVTTINIKAEDPTEYIWVFDLALRGDKSKRIVVSDGAITSREAITYNDSDAIAYGITVSAYPDANGQTHFELFE